MASFLREKVSRNKIRFREDGFDLDLTYITPRIIAMGFPSEKVEGFYRNPIGEVQRFYEKRHKELYKLYNLCAERSYEPAKFNGRVTTYPFEDHNAPPVQLIVDCCNDVHDWLNKDEKNIVGINCKAGKGRTGLIICCYLMHAGICKNADDAMLFYGTRRTKDGKGVTIASQKRYVRYYEQVLKLGRVPDPKMLKIKKIIVNSVPNFSGDPCATVIIKNKEVGTTPSIKIAKGATSYEIPADIPVIGDVKVQMDVKKGKSVQHTCHFWFNTGFVGSDNKLHFDKLEIDVASKDKKNAHFKPEFSIDVEFEDVEVDTSSMTNGVASPRRDGVKEKKDKKDKKKDKKGKGKEESEEADADDSVEAVVKSPKKDKSRKDKGKDKDPKDSPKSDDKTATSPKSEEKGKDKKDKKSKASESTSETAPEAASFAPPSSSTDDFSTKRKRRQSFYEVDEELENNEELSDSAIEEKELEEYFVPESVDDDDKEEDANQESPKAAKSSDKASSDSSDADADKKPAKKQEDSSESSQVSEPKDKSESDKGSSKSIAISATSSSSRRGLNSPAPAEKSEEPKKDEPKDTPKSKKDKKDKDSSKGSSDSPSQKSKKSKKSSDN